MGDVAMTVPVIQSFAEQNPDVEIVMVSRPFFKPFFDRIPQVEFIGVDLNEKHKGFKGMFQLAQELKSLNITHYADLHNVLRTKILRFFLQFSIPNIASIDKGREEKKALTRKENKVLRPLKSSFERYADVFRALGFSLNLQNVLPQKENATSISLSSKITFNPQKTAIGIAPFAQHEGKILPFETVKKVVEELSKNSNYNLYLLGGGEKEKQLLESIEKENVISIVGKLSLTEELALIQQLNVLFSMDSANMHLASLVGTRVISFWGATHPYAGFLGFGQSEKDCIQRNDLDCRPCSIFGNKPCWRGDWACLNIDSQIIIDKIESSLES